MVCAASTAWSAPATSRGRKLLRHPALGELLLHHTVLTVAAAPEQKLVTFGLVPADAERVAALLA